MPLGRVLLWRGSTAIADPFPIPDMPCVRVKALIDRLAKHAPSIVVRTLCASLLAELAGAPAWMPRVLAIVVGSLALLLFVARVRRHDIATPADDAAPRSWFEYELAGKGTPPGYYVLAFFGFSTLR